ncbi:immunoglobulin lambda-1 light chain-like isoform X42 [Pimephales promelas]|uniref:immunoglobulin lambda-1 light chain-like isoform X42 n=1 Tax=Pimephales promelas TaxID=90988 RepID=UPI001955B2C8|nr:immunoglobulin lambda-1 light chain-like isoform X42 [Pimephales promelas]
MLINLCTVVLIMIHGVEGLSLNQNQKVLVKLKGKTVTFRCEVTGLGSGNFVHWYHKKDGETFKRLLYISKSGIATSEAKDFVSEKIGNSYGIKLKETKEEHAGMYYCACWDGGLIKRFGTGTRLIVTDQGKDTTKSPTLTAYLPTTKESGKQTRICQATDMFPDLVKFNWKKKSNTGDWTDVSEDNVVEQRNVDPVIVTSILIVDQYTAGEDLYQCTLTYEGGMKQKTLQNDKDPANNNEGATVKPTCSPDNKTSTIQISGSSDQIPSLYLFVYAYGVMLMKNGVYFCAVLIVLLKRKVGNKKESA